MLGFFRMKWRFLVGSRALREYDRVIFSNEAISARVWVSGKKIYYAHSISRHLFDQREQYIQKVNRWMRPFFGGALSVLRLWYLADLRAMDLILANSHTNADFLRQLAPQVRVEVLHPPVDLEEFYPSDIATHEQPDGGYFLSYARLAHAKRIDLIIQAFLQIPDQKLLIIYGKNDPQLEEFRMLAGQGIQSDGLTRSVGASNIEFRTLDDNSELPAIVRRARAVVYVSKNEDFGMNTIESLASGVPVIAVAEGGFLETMIDGETGILLKPDFALPDLVQTVQSFSLERAISMRSECLRQAEKFSLKIFAEKLRDIL